MYVLTNYEITFIAKQLCVKNLTAYCISFTMKMFHGFLRIALSPRKFFCEYCYPECLT